MFVVGQTTPKESEVPGPHARKNTNTAKLRLMIVAWILIKKTKDPAKQRVKLSRLIKYFPDQTELQMRQRLKIKGNVSKLNDTHTDRLGIPRVRQGGRISLGLLEAQSQLRVPD
jgi:hypothetical protein